APRPATRRRLLPAGGVRGGEPCRLEKASREAAVDHHGRAGDVAGAVGGEEARDVAELLRRAPATDRNLLQVGLGRALRIKLCKTRRVDSAGSDAVDRDAPRAELAGQRLRPTGHAWPNGVAQRQ